MLVGGSIEISASRANGLNVHSILDSPPAAATNAQRQWARTSHLFRTKRRFLFARSTTSTRASVLYRDGERGKDDLSGNASDI